MAKYDGLIILALLSVIHVFCFAKSETFLLTDANNTSIPQISVQIGEQEVISYLVNDANDPLLSGMYFKEIFQKAQQGDPNSQIRLGYMYATGKGVEKNDKEALRWYRKAADRGKANAQYYIGQVYFRGYFGLRPNSNEGVKWYRKAAAQGLVMAQLDLGQTYMMGINGIEPNMAEAAIWLTMAAEQNNTEAQSQLAWLYQDSKDYEKAEKWYLRAAELGEVEAQSQLAMMYYEGKEVKQDYKAAMKWFTKMAEGADGRGWVGLGIMYARGQGVEKNAVEAEKYFDKVAEQKSNPGFDMLFRMGIQYVEGTDVKQVLKAAQLGYSPAQYYVGTMYLQGQGVGQNFQEAMNWSLKAGEHGGNGARYNIGIMYANGQGVTRDYVEAYTWLWLASGMNEDGTVNKFVPRPNQQEARRESSKFYAMMGMYAPDAIKQLKNVEKQLTPEQIVTATQKAKEIKSADIQYMREHYGYKSPEELKKKK
jgi:TPR repeat protein